MNRTLKIDQIGFFISITCSVHCALLPAVLTISSLASLNFLLDPMIELTILIISVSIATFSFIHSYLKHHREIRSIIIFLIALIFICFSRVPGLENFEIILTVTGTILIAYAHFVNIKLCKLKPVRKNSE